MGSLKADVAIIGAGVNGLAAATILAREGLRVLVLEQNPLPGGLAGGGPSPHPPSLFAYAIGLVPPEVQNLLGLELDNILHRPEPSWVELGEDGSVLFRWWRSRGRLAEESRRAGVEGLPALLELAERFWRCYKRLGLYYTIDPPSPEHAASQVDECDQEAAVFVEERASRILQEYLPVWAWGLVLYPSMYRSNGFSLAYYLQNRNIWDLPVAGMRSVARALEDAARKAGAEIVYGARVEGLITEKGRATGLRLAGGRRVEARSILYTPPLYTLPRIEGVPRLLEEYELRLLRRMAAYRLDVVRVDYLLRKQPTPPREEGWRGHPIIVYWTGRGGGEYSYVSLYTPGMPPMVQGSGGIHDPLEPLPPGVEEGDIMLINMRTRRDQGRCCGNTTGHPDHVPMIDPYILNKRPLPGWHNYRTSIPGLYHGSASSYPGGEINLVAGLNAAARILHDLGYTERARAILEGLSRGGVER